MPSCGDMPDSVQVEANPSDVAVQSASNHTSTELTGRRGETIISSPANGQITNANSTIAPVQTREVELSRPISHSQKSLGKHRALIKPDASWKEALHLAQHRRVDGARQYRVIWADTSVPTWMDDSQVPGKFKT